MPAAARMKDKAKHDAPHCHGPHGPQGPVAHPSMMPDIIMGSPNVKMQNEAAATLGSMTKPCMLAGCIPGGPGVIMKGSMTVMVNGKPAARVDDIVSFPACIAPIPSPTGKVMAPGATKVIIGG
jgi:uncharacterized Zn-binding protein involved in type VI secretion